MTPAHLMTPEVKNKDMPQDGLPAAPNHPAASSPAWHWALCHRKSCHSSLALGQNPMVRFPPKHRVNRCIQATHSCDSAKIKSDLPRPPLGLAPCVTSSPPIGCQDKPQGGTTTE